MPIDPVMWAAITAIVGAMLAAVWSFLMAAKVAAPRAAAKSKLLLVNILTGATPEDKVILETVKGALVRPEIEAAFAHFKMPEFPEMPDVPEFDYAAISAPLMARLDRLENEFPNIVGTHVSMAIKGVQATEGKAIAKYVEELGIEGLTAEAQEAAVERLTTKQRLAYQLMTMKVPPKTKKEHPVSTMLFEQSRGLVAQQIIESDARESGNVVYDNNGPARSGTFRPGYNP